MMVPNFKDLIVISKADGTYVVTAPSSVPLHITPDYGPLLYADLEAAVIAGDCIPYVYDLDAKPEVATLNLLDACKRLIDECRDLRDLGEKLPMSDVKFIELVKWNQANRKWENSGQNTTEQPPAPTWFKKFATSYFADRSAQ